MYEALCNIVFILFSSISGLWCLMGILSVTLELRLWLKEQMRFLSIYEVAFLHEFNVLLVWATTIAK